MKLKYIELKGFKSFARKERLEFEKQITAIVGPNGSGKSNIAEGFRFVLGEQSMKSLRSKKTEDLLFNGSSSLPRVNRASVTLVFDNSKREIKTAFDEIQIERVIHRDATNEYYINGSHVRLKDITEMLAEAKIGSAGHHIISQGEADRMLSLTPRERKVYLEEALGLTQYQNKKNDALKKLAKTEENLISIHSLIRELAPHVRYLEREMKLIEQKKELSSELEAKTEEYASRFFPFITTELNRVKKEYEEILLKIEEVSLKQKGEAATENKDEYTEKRSHLQKEILKISSTWESLRQERSSLERQIGRLEAKLELTTESLDGARAEPYLVDAAERLLKIKDLLERARIEEDILIIKNVIQEALELTKGGGDTLEENREEIKRNNLEKIQKELEVLRASIEVKMTEEDSLLRAKQTLEKALSDTFHSEEKNKSESEKNIFELHSLEVTRGALSRELEALKQEEAYFYASLEEVMIITGVSIKKEAIRSKDGESLLTKAELRDMEHDVERLKLKIEGMQVGNTKEIEREYKSTKEREIFLETEVRDLEDTSTKLSSIIDDLNTRIEVEFKEGLEKISSLFSTFFSQMFTGGSAGLSIVTLPKRSDEEESEPEKEEGVEITLSLPHKKLRSVAMLSGGEKTLVSIALVFALSQVNPPPFLILDETDAALDEANSHKYGDALKELSKYSQLILITHNRETMSRAGMLYGITMGRASASELLSIDLEEAEKIAR